MKLKNIILLALIVTGMLSSCSEEWLEQSPNDSLNAAGAITSVQAANLVLRGSYSRMQDGDYYGGTFMLNSDVKGDDVQCFANSRRFDNEYNYNTTADFGSLDLWKEAYISNNQAVSVLLAFDDIADGTEAERNNVKGEALAISALVHFDLVRWYGKTYLMDNGAGLGVPIVKEPVNYANPPARNTVAEVYDYVIGNLEVAVGLLSKKKTPGRINFWAAKALLSRVYLYKGENQKALDLAEEVIANTAGYGLIERAGYVDSWKNEFTKESLFEIINTSDDNPADRESIGYVAKPQSDGYGAVSATDAFIARITADAADVRGQFILPHEDDRNGYIAKYPGTGGESFIINNIKVIRMAEVYLNASEAAFKLGGANLTKSLTYLNEVYKRATDKELVSADLSLNRILVERRNELVLEGHRLFDAMRNNETMDRTGGHHFTTGEAKSVNRSWNKTVMAIPQYELDANSSLVQNPGYN